MKIARANDQFVFQLGRREKQVLFELLKRYPCIPPAHQRLHSSTQLPDASQRLLDEALAQQRLRASVKTNFVIFAETLSLDDVEKLFAALAVAIDHSGGCQYVKMLGHALPRH